MKLFITKTDFEIVGREIASKQLKLEELGVKLGDAMSRSGSFPAASPEYAAVHLEIQNLQQSMDGLKNVLAKYEVMSEDDIIPDVVGTYSLVVLTNDKCVNLLYYFLPTGISKAISGGYRIATPESPVGRAVMGKRVGDSVELRLPDGTKNLKVTDIGQKY